MTTLVAYYLYLLAGILVVWMLRQHVTGKCDILSIRNVAIGGFIIFQLTSAALHLHDGQFVMFRISDPASAGLEFAMMATVFLVVGAWAYRLGLGIQKPAGFIARNKGDAGSSFLIALAFAMTLLALVMRFGVFIPVVAIATNIMGIGFGAIACGLAGWVWGRRLTNPMLALVAVLVLVLNTGIGMWGQFGRRGLVAMAGGMLWGIYYSKLRYLTFKQMAVRLAILGVGPLLFIALYSSVRSSSEGGRTITGHLQAMKDGSAVEGLKLLFEGQATGSVALWVIENYPENYEYDHLLTIQYFFIAQVPRTWWETKPEPLSTKTAALGNVKGVDQGKVLLPAGIIGNAAAEGGWYAILIYGIAAGLFLRFFDELVRRNPLSPFVVIPVGCQLGQILGLARGETSLFANQFVIAFTGVWLATSFIARLLDSMGFSREAEAFLEHQHEDADWSDYGDDAWRDAHAADDHTA